MKWKHVRRKIAYPAVGLTVHVLILLLARVPDAHRMLKASTHFGKLVLRVRDEGV